MPVRALCTHASMEKNTASVQQAKLRVVRVHSGTEGLGIHYGDVILETGG